MRSLLKEALKALCGINQWSYAVFWKFGCYNPKLLIWEECYLGVQQNSYASQDPTLGNQGITSHIIENDCNGGQVGDHVRLLMGEMMLSKQVNVVGEGLVGRAAFSGNHQWFVSGNYEENAHPTEVLNEVRLQFSAGMQTIAVIPVLPHGVVQVASPLTIMENVGFVHDVKSLILQLGCVPSTFTSDPHTTKSASSIYRLPDVATSPLTLHANHLQIKPIPAVSDWFNQSRSSSQTVRLANRSSDSPLAQFQDNLQVSGSTFMMSNLTRDSNKSHGDHYAAKISNNVSNIFPPLNGLIENKVGGDKVIPLMPNSMIDIPIYHITPGFRTCPPSSPSGTSAALLKLPVKSDGGMSEEDNRIFIGLNSISAPVHNIDRGHHATEGCDASFVSGNGELAGGINGQSFQRSNHTHMVVHDTDSSVKELDGFLNMGDKLNSSLQGHENWPEYGGYMAKDNLADVHEVLQGHPRVQRHMPSTNFSPNECCNGSQVPSLKDPVMEDGFFPTSGEDLFDVVGVDLKNKLLNENAAELHNKLGADTKGQVKEFLGPMTLQNLSFDICSNYCEANSESGIFSSFGSDHLLDAIISGVSSAARQISDDDMSCRTTLSKISDSSVPGAPYSSNPKSGLVNMSERMKGQLCGCSKTTMCLGESTGTSIRSAYGKNDGGSCSPTSSTYASQISSWIEQVPSVSISTANSKKIDDVGKTNHKRLKPGENPRRRPKDRQMIQDRVKELRELVPNGAKCSIDALLERTIKHMLFLQCVTEHANKLQQTVESKIMDGEGGMLLKDNFEGGATWAFELGSHPMDCPIVVEDLNPPRQLLLELLCEDRGFLLEIADIIRGLGLTILKGVVEARNDKIWARFAVEANRDVTRMEVFISLVHVLEQNLNGCIASANGITNESMKAHPISMCAN